LLCGSATDVEQHERVIAGAKIDAVVTDPPYGVGIEYSSFDDSPENVAALIADFMPLILRWPVVALTSGHRVLWSYPRPDWIMAWIHQAATSCGPWGFLCFNPIMVWGKDPYLQNRLGGRADSVVMNTDREEETGHPVIKPIKVWKWLIERMTIKPGARVLDPFSGSGTTIIASEMLGRLCCAIELSPTYVDVSVKRWSKFTGRAAVLADDGLTFDEVAAARGVPT
jgi:DNA modification methylase